MFPYPIITVPENASSQLEQLGTKSKFWYRDETGRNRLFKQGRQGTGENWAEKVACEICRLMGLPHAEYDLAEHGHQRGVVTPTFVPVGGKLMLGNELLAGLDPAYPQQSGLAHYRTEEHTVDRVMSLLGKEQIRTPCDWECPSEILSAADVFVGYLLLDVLISNQDRHHENWGVVLTSGKGFLAPTFDHASSLGRNESDQVRCDRLTTRDQGRNVRAYVAKARSALHNEGIQKPLTTMEAYSAAARTSPGPSKYWLSQMRRIDSSAYKHIFSSLPAGEASSIAVEFALRMLEENSMRLADHED